MASIASAIAHLAPEKREAAWEFYLDRLESSAAADTLGGVMLLLEAHLAFFDDLPARLGQAVQQIETAFRAPGPPASSGAASLVVAAPTSTSTLRQRRRICLVAGIAAAVGGATVYIALSTFRRAEAPNLGNVPAHAVRLPSPRAGSIRVEPWNDPATHRQQGAVISFASVSWTERTSSGGASVYVLSPAEEVRRDLEALRQASK